MKSREGKVCFTNPDKKEGVLDDMDEKVPLSSECFLRKEARREPGTQEGQTIPLKVSMALPMVVLQPGKNNLVFTRDTYLLISRSKIEISLDGQRWAGINDWKSQKALLGFDKSTLFVGFGATKEEGTQISNDVIAK